MSIQPFSIQKISMSAIPDLDTLATSPQVEDVTGGANSPGVWGAGAGAGGRGPQAGGRRVEEVRKGRGRSKGFVGRRLNAD